MEITINQICQAIGLAGFAMYMLSYFLLQIGKVRGESGTYATMNLSAASMVLISLIHEFNLPSALIQVAWILISLIGLVRMQLKPVTAQTTDQALAAD